VPVIQEDDPEAESAAPSESGTPGAGGVPRKKPPGHPGRAALPKHLERVTEVNDVPPELCTCPLCGETMTTVSHSVCEILDVRPAELFVRRRLDERVACPNDDTIVSAPTPPELVERAKLDLGRRVPGGQVPRAPADRAAVLAMVEDRHGHRSPDSWARGRRSDDPLSPIARMVQKLRNLIARRPSAICSMLRGRPA
jgi:hypothetical protein